MKYIFTPLFFSLVLFIGCNTETKSKLFSPESLPSDQFSINTDKDTTLQTKNGALLKIPKGALSVDGGVANLEIKEAYSIQQMIQGGLVTNSNGEPLSSGGMIYINAAGRQKITFNQPIKVAVPADYLAKDMQLFKGQKDENGNINWTEPVALPENKQLTAIDRGKVLFEQKCGSCHIVGKPFTGPDLAHFMKRFPDGEENSIYYGHLSEHFRYHSEYKTDTSYPNRYENEHHLAYYLYKCNLQAYCCIGMGQIFENDSTNYLLDIYNYIQNESDRLNLSLPGQTYLKDCTDSCVAYKEKINSLNEQKQKSNEKRNELVKENGPMVSENLSGQTSQNNTGDTIPLPLINFDEKVSPQNFDAEYYQFTIESFGWFNIDILLKNVDGVEESELFVRIVGEYKQKTEVFLIIPSKKVYGEGGLTGRTEDEYAFFYKTGKLPLPQNAKAYILAMTETKTSIAFSLKEFTTSPQQQFEISLQQSTMDEFNATIQKIGLDELKVKVNETKNANEIRKTDLKLEEIEKEIKNAEGLKPKNCDCDCLRWPEKPKKDSSNKIAFAQ